MRLLFLLSVVLFVASVLSFLGVGIVTLLMCVNPLLREKYNNIRLFSCLTMVFGWFICFMIPVMSRLFFKQVVLSDGLLDLCLLGVFLSVGQYITIIYRFQDSD